MRILFFLGQDLILTTFFLDWVWLPRVGLTCSLSSVPELFLGLGDLEEEGSRGEGGPKLSHLTIVPSPE